MRSAALGLANCACDGTHKSVAKTIIQMTLIFPPRKNVIYATQVFDSVQVASRAAIGMPHSTCRGWCQFLYLSLLRKIIARTFFSPTTWRVEASLLSKCREIRETVWRGSCSSLSGASSKHGPGNFSFLSSGEEQGI